MPLLKQSEKRKKIREDLFKQLESEGGTISGTIKTFRKILGWDQQTLAKTAQVSLSALRRIEQGHHNIRLDTLEKILKCFSLKLVIKIDH